MNFIYSWPVFRGVYDFSKLGFKFLNSWPHCEILDFFFLPESGVVLTEGHPTSEELPCLDNRSNNIIMDNQAFNKD